MFAECYRPWKSFTRITQAEVQAALTGVDISCDPDTEVMSRVVAVVLVPLSPNCRQANSASELPAFAETSRLGVFGPKKFARALHTRFGCLR